MSITYTIQRLGVGLGGILHCKDIRPRKPRESNRVFGSKFWAEKDRCQAVESDAGAPMNCLSSLHAHGSLQVLCMPMVPRT